MSPKEFCDSFVFRPVPNDMLLMFGDKASIMFSHLVNFAEMHADTDGWFFFTQQQITDKVGYLRTQTEAALKTLNDAGLIEIGHRPSDPRRYFRISVTVEQLAEIFASRQKAQRPAQTPTAPKKTAPRAKQTANTAKETSNHTEQPLEMAQPVGKAEQLPAENLKTDKAAAKKAEIEAAAVRLIEHLNAVAGRNFRPVAANIANIARVLRSKEGTEDDIRLVIDYKTSRWANDPHMRDSLNPETLCRPSKFSRYLDEANSAISQSQRPMSTAIAMPADGLRIDLPNGQRFGDYFDRKDQRKVDMIRATLTAHPGIHVHLNPQLADMAYLSSLNETELQAMLKRARLKWYPPNTFTDSKELPF